MIHTVRPVYKMTSSKYKELRKKVNEEVEQIKKASLYKKQKQVFLILTSSFNSTDNMLYLANAIKVGIGILESEEFPIKEYKKYEKKQKS